MTPTPGSSRAGGPDPQAGESASGLEAATANGLPVVAVVGRANVGKSTLVNRLVGRRVAIEHPEPGVTRDVHGHGMTWNGVPFLLVDTGGWEPRARGLSAKVMARAERAANESDLIVFVLDVETGITADDEAVAKRLRRSGIPVVVVANKVDSQHQESEAARIERLGLGPVVPVSALHGRGSGDLLDLVVEMVRDKAPGRAPAQDALSVAVVGRPNVGKSSLFNRLVGDDRSIVHDEPGTTRDAVDTIVEVEGRRYRFIDTAGMRKRAKGAEGPEYYGLVRSLRAIDAADVALHVIDAGEGPTEQDQKIARRVADAGCAGAIVLNKWDLVDPDLAEVIAADTLQTLRFVSWAPLLRISATAGRGLNRIVPTIESVRASWERRVPTAALNAWLREVVERVPLGGRGVRPTKIRYVTQARTRPPTFVVFTSGGAVAPEAVRALERRLRERFDFAGTPIRILVRRQTRRGSDD